MSTTKTPQQLHNLREALEVWWPSVPEANVFPQLKRFSRFGDQSTDCKTIACFGGWAARWPGLAAQGVQVDGDGHPEFIPPDGSGHIRYGCGVATPIFGDSALFYPRGDHPADRNFIGTDHELVTNRLRWALER